MTMPRGIYEALFPRFLSQGGREITPAVITEGARELALCTLILRFFGRKADDLFAPWCVADKDAQLFFFVETFIFFVQFCWHTARQQGLPFLPEASGHIPLLLVVDVPLMELLQQMLAHCFCGLAQLRRTFWAPVFLRI